jgi:translation initiation factor 1 (eIF-1/SUI1)
MRKSLLILFVVMAVVLFGVVSILTLRRLTDQAVDAVTLPQEQQLDLGAVVTQVRELSRLETASMRVMHVGTIKQSYRMVPNSLGGDEIQFLATGDVIAGIDLSQLAANDVWREPDGTVVMRLPAAHILISRVDNRQSKVLSRKTGMLRRADIDLESRARQFAEQNIRAEALKKGIIPMAQASAETKLADLLHKMGAKKVRFVSPKPPAPASS